MKKNFAGVSLLLALVLAAAPVSAVSAKANSAPAYWSGADGSGVIAAEDCPVEVKSELLTLEIPSLPDTQYMTREEFAQYRARVCAEYAFYNPTEEPLEVGLMFPFGAVPEYLSYYSPQDGKMVALDDSDRYSVTADGVAVGTELRYTYESVAHSVEHLPAAGKETLGVFREDADCFRYSYTVDTAGAGGDFFLEIRLSYNPARTRILLTDFSNYELDNGDLVLFLYLGRIDPLCFYAVGEKPQVLYTKVTAENYPSDDHSFMENATVVPDGEPTLVPFGAWIEATRPIFGQIGEIDWFNAAIGYLEAYEDGSVGLAHFVPEEISSLSLMRWFSYSLTIPAGGTVVNRVTAPLYPDIAGSDYRYRYLLSPARGWAKFGSLTVEVNTPYLLRETSLSLEKTETGYRFERQGLPLGELSFSIYGSVGGSFTDISGGALVFLGAAGLVGMVGLLIGAIAAVCILVKNKKK